MKAKRASTVDDYETWIAGGVVPTLNRMDNNGESYATVLILDGTRVNDVRVYENGIAPTVISRYGTGGGNVPAIAFHQKQDPISGEISPALGTTSDGMGVMMPAIYEPKSAFEKNWAESEVKNALRANASKSSHAVTHQATVRRLTPVECERLQGFPDNWTAGQADSSRYKQMGNAVAVPVVSWIAQRMVARIGKL